MTPDYLLATALEAKQQGVDVMLVLPRPFKRPPGFPRGKLACEQATCSVYWFKPDKIIAWLKRAGYEPEGSAKESAGAPS